MVFASLAFLFLFLPLLLVAHALTPGLKGRNVVLLLASLLFYAWGEGALVLLMLGSIGVNYGFGLALSSPRFAGRGWVLGAGVAANLLLLGAFKYTNFLVDSLNVVVIGVGLEAIACDPIPLPIGVSFFTFQAISYLVDVQRGDAEAQRNPLTFGLFVALFPQLIAGPIVRYREIADQLSQRDSTRERFAKGVGRFTLGLAKKVLLANPLSVVADAAFGADPGELSAALCWAGALAYTLQIYFDFSGYSDMAIGLGRFFGFELPENFNYPYVSRSITEFWRRWHMSLSRWFRDYLYIPLGGNRGTPRETYRNLVVVFLLCGLWHGAAWNFVVWGAYHGAFLVVERKGWIQTERWPQALAWLYSMAVVVVGWVLFAAPSLGFAAQFLVCMTGLGPEPVPVGLPWERHLNSVVFACTALGVIGSTPWLPRLRELVASSVRLARWRTPVFALGTLAQSLLLWVCLTELAGSTVNPFIYFRF